MSLLYRALRRAAEQEQQTEQDSPSRRLSVPSAGKRLSSFRPLLLRVALVIGGLGAALLFVPNLWSDLEYLFFGPQTLRSGSGVAPSGPAPTAQVSPPAAPTAVPSVPETPPTQPPAPEVALQSSAEPAPQVGVAPAAETGAATVPTTPATPATGPPPAGPAEAEASAVAVEPSPPEPDIAAAGAASVVGDAGYFRDRYEAARRLLLTSQADAALLIYEALLRREPTDRLALLGRAVALQRVDRVSDAIHAYEEVLEDYPDELVAQTHLLALLGRSVPEWALQALGELYATYPRNSLLPAQIAMIHVELNDTANAIRFMERAVVLDPNNAVYQLNLAVLYDRAGQRSAAARSYERALELGAGDGSATLVSDQAVRERLRYLRMN